MAGAFRAALPLPRVVDGFLAGLAEFQEREIGGAFIPRRVRRGDLFVTGSKTPYELRWNSPLGAELELVHIHLAVDQLTAPLETVYQDKAAAAEVIEFFGRDETLAHLSFACAELLSAGTAGNAKRIAAFSHLLAIYIAETSRHRGLTIAAACRLHGFARSRTMCVRTLQKASQSRSWLSWRS